MKRINSIDIARGLVMIIMALDHTRDLLHVDSLTQSPTDLNTTTPVLFFTRWITHLCAPTFVFLSGVSAFLSFNSKKNIAESRKFLITRGLWLIVLEFTVVNFGLWFDIHFSFIVSNVIAAIGFGFIALGLMLNLSASTLGIIGLLIISLHNLSPLVPLPETSMIKKVLMPFFAPAAFPYGNGKMFIIGYPPLPWLGVMLAGFGTGKYFLQEQVKRKQLFIKLGLISLALFVILRFINIFGDGAPWTTQKSGLYTFLSFINLTKYPPSLDFCLCFIGLLLLILVWVEGLQNRFTAFTTVYGKVPLFYFIVHFYIIHLILFIMVFMQGFHSSDLVFGSNFGRPKQGSGLTLWAVYLVWIGIVLLMYPLCKWYGKYKVSHPEKKWLRYL